MFLYMNYENLIWKNKIYILKMKIRPNLESNVVKFRNLEEMTLTKSEKKEKSPDTQYS